MGAKSSTTSGSETAQSAVVSGVSPRLRTFSSSTSSDPVISGAANSNGLAHSHSSGERANSAGFGLLRPSGPVERHRARSLSSVPAHPHPHFHGQYESASGVALPLRLNNTGADSPAETDTSSPEDQLLDTPFASVSGLGAPIGLGLGRFYAAQSLPSHIWSLNGIKCPVCSKFVLPDDIECHLVMCLTKPRLVYNEDILSEDKEECVICLEELQKGDTIARLPCLCIYHKTCIDRWFEVNRSCPEHPGD